MKYPEIKVNLSGYNGIAFAILSKVKSELRKNGVSVDEQAQFVEEATSGGYYELMQTCFKWVNVDNVLQ